MKKLFTILSLLISINGYSQTYAAVHIWKVYPDTVHQGDSVDIDFKWDLPVQMPFTAYSIFAIEDGNGNLLTIWQDDWQKLYDFPKYAVALGDSVQRIRLKIPENAKTGNGKAYGSGTYNEALPIVIKTKVTTGISLHDKDEKYTVRWFTLLGYEIAEPEKNKINIQVKSYENGSIESRQIFHVENQ